MLPPIPLNASILMPNAAPTMFMSRLFPEGPVDQAGENSIHSPASGTMIDQLVRSLKLLLLPSQWSLCPNPFPQIRAEAAAMHAHLISRVMVGMLLPVTCTSNADIRRRITYQKP